MVIVHLALCAKINETRSSLEYCAFIWHIIVNLLIDGELHSEGEEEQASRRGWRNKLSYASDANMAQCPPAFQLCPCLLSPGLKL
jgi:hypothetical protein